MKTVKAKTFIEALRSYRTDPKLVQKYFKDQRLTIAEKKILECWLLLGDNQFLKILSILEPLSATYDPLVDAHKYLILGITLNNKSESKQAIPLLLKAYEVIREYPIPLHHFVAIHNLFLSYLNFKDPAGMKYCLDEMKKMDLQGVRQQVSHLHDQYHYHAFIGELKKAGQFLDQAEKLKDEMAPVLIIGQLVNRYTYYVKTGEFNRCVDVLTEMKKHRKFKHSETFNFMKMMLDHYLKDTPLYVYARNFRDHHLLYHQLLVIKCLEEDDLSGASRSWKELNRIAPHVYRDSFSYQGDVCIFSLCLDKHLAQRKAMPIRTDELPQGKEQRLIYILKNSPSPVKKETLYEYIWGNPMEDKSDVIKLKKLVSRCRSNFEEEIVYRKGCYQLIQTGKKAA